MFINGLSNAYSASILRCNNTHAHAGSFTPPDVYFALVHVDIMGPLLNSKGYSYVLTLVDRFTRWPKVIPLMNASSNSVAHGLLLGWVAHFGVPTTITSDRGDLFESDVWHRLMRLLGTHYICTMVYHPCTNGVVKWMHKQLKAVIMAHSPQSQWTKVLPLVLLGIRSALKEDIACTSAEIVYRSTLSLPRFLYNLLHRHPGCDILHYKVNIHHLTTLGQFQVLKRNPKFFTLDINGRNNTLSLDHLKPAHLDNPCLFKAALSCPTSPSVSGNTTSLLPEPQSHVQGSE